jgi:hypothetical protein
MPESKSQSPDPAAAHQYAVAVQGEALERINQLERYARQCELRAAGAFDELDEEALLDAAEEYRRQRNELLGSFYPFSNLLTETVARRRLRRRADIYFIILAILTLVSIFWRIW